MSSPSHDSDEQDEEEVIRKFLEESMDGGSPLRKQRKKVKWDLINDYLGSPPSKSQEEDLSEKIVVEKNFLNMLSPSILRDKKKGPSEVNLKRIQGTHPGLNVFSRDPFQYFSSKDLDLERDFGFKGRGGFEGSFDDLKKDSLELALFLCPESKSSLISNDTDFRAVCDYLFYSLSSTISENEFDVLSKTLVDLCSNYKAKWTIDYKKILTIYLNLGMNSSVINNEGIIKRMMKSRLEVVRRIKELKTKSQQHGASVERFSLSKASILPKFALQRSSSLDKKYFRPLLKDSSKMNSSDPEDSLTFQKYACLKRTTKFLSVFIHGQRDRICCIEPYDDWTGLLVMTYLFELMASDKGLFEEYPDVSFDVSQMLNTFIEMFSPRQWSGGARETMGSEISALCDMSKIFLYLGLCVSPDLKTWDPKSLPEGDYFNKDLDHHHNLLFRLSYLIPPTSRGRDLLKASSYLILQFLLNGDKEIVFEAPVCVSHLSEFLEEPFVKDRLLNLFTREHYLSCSLLRIIDLIVGNDPLLDFSKELIPHVNQIASFLGTCIRKLKDDLFDSNPSYLKEVVNQMLCKWNVLSLSSSRAINAKITDFTVSKK